MAKSQKNISKNIRKNIEHRKTTKEDSDIKNTIINALKIMIGIVIFIIILVLITKFANGDFKSKTTNLNHSIIAGQMFNKEEDTYYVVVYSFDNEELTTAIDDIKDSDNKIYKININDKMNSSIIGTEENITSNLQELKIKEETLLKIENKKITDSINGSSEIISYLQGLPKNSED